MKIPSSKRERFARELIDMCFTSQSERISRNSSLMSFALHGAPSVAEAAIFNKTHIFLEQLHSLLYSPHSVQVSVVSDEIMNAVDASKAIACANKIEQFTRASDTDTTISDAVWLSLVKGMAIVKCVYKRGGFNAYLIQPEAFGVLNESYTSLDSEMEAFVHQSYITPWQFQRLIRGHPDEASLLRRAKNYVRRTKDSGTNTFSPLKQIVTGTLRPFQADPGSPGTKGIANWMEQPSPWPAPGMAEEMLELNELWVWDDTREDWATFQLIGDDMLIFGKYHTANALAWDPLTSRSDQFLKGKHPYFTVSASPSIDYFFGRPVISNVMGLQMALNKRLDGINAILRRQENPPWTFSGGKSVTQTVISRLNKPGGYFVDSSPTAKAQPVVQPVPPDLFLAVKEIERMFDETSGVPPIAQGKGESGVRSDVHAETLAWFFSPRFKARAIAVERDVSAILSGILDQAKAFVAEPLTGWALPTSLSMELPTKVNPFNVPPAKGLEPIIFSFADIPPDWRAEVTGHSTSPAFEAERRSMLMTLLQAQAISGEDLLRFLDVPDRELLQGELLRKQAAQADVSKLLLQAKLMQATKGKK
jgi:hypothetical protein